MTTITLNVENREDIVNALHELADTLDGNISEISHGMLGASGDTFEVDYDDDDLELEDADDEPNEDFVRLRLENGKDIFVQGEKLSMKTDAEILMLCEDNLIIESGEQAEVFHVVFGSEIAETGEYQSIF